MKTLYDAISMGNTEISDDLRKARSERMKELNASGKAGAAFGKLGGRPKKIRATDIAIEEIQKKGKQLADELLSLALESESEKIRSDNLKQIYALEEQQRKIQVEEEVRYDQLKRDDLLELVIGNLFELVANGEIALTDIIDGEATEIGGIAELGEGNGSLTQEA